MSKDLEILKRFIGAQNQRLQDDISKQGYKDDSPYKNNPSNTIYGTPQGTPITMKGVSTPLIGMDEFGNKQKMYPGQEYYYPGSQVTETPIAQNGGTSRSKIRKPTEKEIKEWSEPGFRLNSVTDYFDPVRKKVTQSWFGDITRNEQAIQNNLQPARLIQGDLNTGSATIQQPVRVPQYYDVIDTNNQTFGGGETFYKSTDLSDLNELPTEGWSRKTTPHYQGGGETWGKNLTPKQLQLKKEVERNNRKFETKAKWDEHFAQEKKKKEAKAWVANSMQEAYKSPLMSPGYFTPEGALIGAMQAGFQSGKDLSEGEYKSAAMHAGLAALPFAPQIIKKAGSAFSKTPVKEGMFSTYVTPKEAAIARAERMLAQESKWKVNSNNYTKDKFKNISDNFEEVYANEIDKTPNVLGTNAMGKAFVFKDNGLSPANQSRIAAHETGHFYRNMPDEANEWNSFFDFSKHKHRTRIYLKGKPTASESSVIQPKTGGLNLQKQGVPHGDEIRERAAQLKDYIAQKNGIPLNKDFTVTQAQLDDALENYVKDTGLDNTMTPMLNSLKDKEGFLKAMNKYALGTVPLAVGVGQLDQKRNGGIINNNMQQYQYAGSVKLKDERYDNRPVIENTEQHNSIDRKGVLLALKERQDALKDAHELRTTGQIKRPRSAKYTQSAPRQAELKAYVPQSTISKTWEVATHPMTAFGYVARNEDLPDHFSNGAINAHEQAVDMINPFFYVDQAGQLVKNVATGHPLDAAGNVLSILPVGVEFSPQIRQGLKLIANAASPANLRNTVGSYMMDRQVAKGLKPVVAPRLRKIDLSDKAAINVKNDIARDLTPEQYDKLLADQYAHNAYAFDNPIVEFKGYAQPSSFVLGFGNRTTRVTDLERRLGEIGIDSKNDKLGKLFKEKFCAPGSECAKSANAITSRTYTDITGKPFLTEENAHNAWHMQDQMTRHGGEDVTGLSMKVGDRVLMGNGVDQSTYAPGYIADRSVRHAGMYAGVKPNANGDYVPLVFESGKNNAMYINPLIHTFTGFDTAKKVIRPAQLLDNQFGKSLVEKNLRYAFRDKPSVANYSSNNKAVQQILDDAEKHREVIKRTHDITNDEFDELRNSLIGIGAQETKLNNALPGSRLAKAKIQLQNQLTNVGLTEPIKRTMNVVKQTLNNSGAVNSNLPKFPGTSVIEMEAAQLSKNSNIPFEKALAEVKSGYQPQMKYIKSTPTPSKGMFRQKFQTEADRVSGLGKDLKNKNSIENGLGQMAENYATVKKLYPDATPRQLMDLTTLMWNSPGKVKNKKLVDFYLFGKDNPDPSKFNFDYIRKVNNAKDDLINIHPQRGASEPYYNFFRNNKYPEIQYQKGGNVKYGTPEYEEAYNRGEVITEDGQRSPILLDEVVIQNNYKRPRGFWEQSRDKFLKDNKDANLFEAIGSVATYPLSVGQHALTYAIKDKVQDPSEAWGYNTKEGWFDSPGAFGRNLVDFSLNAGLDPANALGAGILTKENALSKLGKIRTGITPELRQGLRTAGPSLNSSINNIGNASKNLEDLNYAKSWAKKYGYELPKNLERIAQSDELTNRTVRGLANRHNTFVRGVSTNWDVIGQKNPEVLRHLESLGIDYRNNPQQAAEYMATHIPGNTGYGRYGLQPGENALYLSNSVPTAEGYTYGDGYIVKTKRPTDFSSLNRNEWLTNNDFDAHLGFKGSPFGTGIVKNDYIKRFPTTLRETLAITGDPNKMSELQKAVKQKELRYNDLAHQSWRKYNDKIDLLKYKTDPAYRNKFLIDDADNRFFLKNSPNVIDKINFKYLNTKRDLDQIYYNALPALDIVKGVYGDPDVWKAFGKNLFGKLDPFSHYAVKGNEGEKMLDAIKSVKVNPETWQNTSRAHINKYTNKLSRKEEGGNTQMKQNYIPSWLQ